MVPANTEMTKVSATADADCWSPDAKTTFELYPPSNNAQIIEALGEQLRFRHICAVRKEVELCSNYAPGVLMESWTYSQTPWHRMGVVGPCTGLSSTRASNVSRGSLVRPFVCLDFGPIYNGPNSNGFARSSSSLARVGANLARFPLGFRDSNLCWLEVGIN